MKLYRLRVLLSKFPSQYRHNESTHSSGSENLFGGFATGLHPRFSGKLLGHAYVQLGRLQDTVSRFEGAVELQPANPLYRYNLGPSWLCGFV
jgi:hypothetical protein